MNGAAYRSLTSETRVAEILRALEWNVVHSAFYTDATEDKDREIDVAARRMWTRPRENQHVHLQLLIECKTPKNPILLAEAAIDDGPERLYFVWSGRDDDVRRAEIRELLHEYKLDAMSVLDRFDAATYPDGEATINGLVPDAPKPPFRASAARESANDANSGALWDGIRQVFSALNGTAAEENAIELQALRDDIGAGDEINDDWAVDRLRDAAQTVNLYHPIVVAAAPLHRLTQKEKLVPAKWARVVQARVGVAPSRWVDLVAADAFEEYAAKLTESYDRFFTRRKCRRV